MANTAAEMSVLQETSQRAFSSSPTLKVSVFASFYTLYNEGIILNYDGNSLHPKLLIFHGYVDTPSWKKNL